MQRQQTLSRWRGWGESGGRAPREACNACLPAWHAWLLCFGHGALQHHAVMPKCQSRALCPLCAPAKQERLEQLKGPEAQQWELRELTQARRAGRAAMGAGSNGAGRALQPFGVLAGKQPCGPPSCILCNQIYVQRGLPEDLARQVAEVSTPHRGWVDPAGGPLRALRCACHARLAPVHTRLRTPLDRAAPAGADGEGCGAGARTRRAGNRH